mgnify:CR=1 FL=1
MRLPTLALMSALAVTVTSLALPVEASAQTRIQPAKPAQPMPGLQKRAPQPAKADLVIRRSRVLGPDTFKFYVENQGAAPSLPTAVQVENATIGGAGNQAIGGLQAGTGMWVEVKIWPNVKAGDKIELYADIGNKLAESNENNNAFSFNW